VKQTESVSSTVATQQNAIKSEIDQIYDVIAEPRGYHPGEPGALASICYAACSLIGEKFGEEGIPVIAHR